MFMDDKTLKEIKYGLGMTGNSTGADETLKQKIATVESYLIGSGISNTMMNDPLAIGCIVVGVTDIWNLKSGEIHFSPVFQMLLEQLKARSAEKKEVTGIDV